VAERGTSNKTWDVKQNAFPNAMGYTQPRNYTSNGTRIDYSSVDEGGPFGIKKLHNNSPLPLPDKYQ